MTFALIEVEATAKKAARGAGYSWGMAEEAGKATRWLCAAGIDGVAGLAALLERVDGRDPAAMAPTSLGGDWRAETGEVCPLAAGAALSDGAVFWAGEHGKRIADVTVPVLMLPFAANAAQRLDAPVTLEWNGVRAVTDGTTTSLAADDEAALFTAADLVSVQTGGRLGRPLASQTRATPAERCWAVLNRFAHRTYAPDTEESRLRGAGAGLTDND